jgi:DNA-binding GntR family transcriptional regulator
MASKQQYVYDEIRSRIIDNKYVPGEVLLERAISDELDVSRTPIREAFRRLESDGFVKIIPHKGVFVSGVSIDDLLEIFEFREALEKMAVRLFIAKANDATFKRIEKCSDEQLKAHKDGDRDRFMKKDMDFHRIIAEGSNNNRLISGISSIYDLVNRLAMAVENDPLLVDMAERHHRSLIGAIKKRDIDAAEKAMEVHIREVKEYHISRQLGMSF